MSAVLIFLYSISCHDLGSNPSLAQVWLIKCSCSCLADVTLATGMFCLTTPDGISYKGLRTIQ
jgi:hypothetical protein